MDEVEIEIEVVFKKQKHLYVVLGAPTQDAPYKSCMTFERYGKGWVIKLNGYGSLPIGGSEVLKRTFTDRISSAAGCHVRVVHKHRKILQHFFDSHPGRGHN